MSQKQPRIDMEEQTEKHSKNRSNFITEIILIIAVFGAVICLTYFLSLFTIGLFIVIVVLAIIYGVCHTFLEFFRILKRKRKSDG